MKIENWQEIVSGRRSFNIECPGCSADKWVVHVADGLTHVRLVCACGNELTYGVRT
jgi:hypothetical protein